MIEYLKMGGYGFFVWMSYGIAMIVFLGHFFATGTCLKQAKAAIKRRLRREAKP